MDKVFIVYEQNRKTGALSSCIEDNTRFEDMAAFAAGYYGGLSAISKESHRVIVMSNTMDFETREVVWTSDVDVDGWTPEKIAQLLSIEQTVYEPWEFDIDAFHDDIAFYPTAHVRTFREDLERAIEEDPTCARYRIAMSKLKKLIG